MLRNKRVLLAATVAGATMLTSLSAEAFFGPMNWMRGGGWGPGWGGWGGPWSGWGYPYYGGWGYPYYGGWGYPYYGGWGYPYWGAPAVAAPVVTQPTTSAEK
jgi:hypothetical protein